MNSFNIICTTDSEYVPIAECLLTSLNANSPGPVVHLRAVNCSSDDIEKLRSCYSNVNIIVDNIELNTKRDRIQREHGILLQEKLAHGFRKKLTNHRGARWLYSEKMAYCSNIKFNTINRVLNTGATNIFYIDLDSIIRSNLDALYDIIMNNEMVFRVTDITGELSARFENRTVMYHGGMFGAVNNDTNKNIFQAIEDVVSEDMYNWDIDETAIYDAIENSSTDVYRLPAIYKDEGRYNTDIDDYIFNDQSTIWSGAGHVKYTSEKYVDECKKYNDNI
mgnify:CR=1 FL=1|tara:strand:+ start:1101 stop:1934 length:834 start_codon:yes stop_codon:yes gene_type:complete